MTDRSTESHPSDLRVAFPVLEFHVAFGCNMTCESCAHYSNHAHAGNVAPSELERQIALWNGKIVPRSFRLLGGEPTLNETPGSHPHRAAGLAGVQVPAGRRVRNWS